ncbi:MAG: hypothetical protein OXI70_03565 [Chloroflexota bacterium]|nr:hypothetical protein [Chloroflexota bacterium]
MTPELIFGLVGLLIGILSVGAALAWLIVAGQASLRAELCERMDALGTRMAALESRMYAVETRMVKVTARLSVAATRLATIGTRLSAIETRMSAVDRGHSDEVCTALARHKALD